MKPFMSMTSATLCRTCSTHFDTEAVIALIAPRPVLFQNGDQDNGSPADGIRAIEAAARPAYRLHGKENRIAELYLPRPGPRLYEGNVDKNTGMDG